MLPRNVQLPFGFQSQPPDHPHNGRLSHPPLRLSDARPLPIDRTHSGGTRWRAAAKPLIPVAYLLLSPTIGHLPKLPPSTISGSGEVFGDPPRGARQTSTSIRDLNCRRSSECPHRAPSSLASVGYRPPMRPALDGGRDPAETHKRSL